MVDREEYKTEKEKRIKTLKDKANEMYLKIKENQKEYIIISKEYVEILKEIELEMVKPNF